MRKLSRPVAPTRLPAHAATRDRDGCVGKPAGGHKRGLRHFGSGLPTIYESARISSNLICESYGERRERIDFATELLAARAS